MPSTPTTIISVSPLNGAEGKEMLIVEPYVPLQPLAVWILVMPLPLLVEPPLVIVPEDGIVIDAVTAANVLANSKPTKHNATAMVRAAIIFFFIRANSIMSDSTKENKTY